MTKVVSKQKKISSKTNGRNRIDWEMAIINNNIFKYTVICVCTATLGGISCAIYNICIIVKQIYKIIITVRTNK